MSYCFRCDTQRGVIYSWLYVAKHPLRRELRFKLRCPDCPLEKEASRHIISSGLISAKRFVYE